MSFLQEDANLLKKMNKTLQNIKNTLEKIKNMNHIQ